MNITVGWIKEIAGKWSACLEASLGVLQGPHIFDKMEDARKAIQGAIGRPLQWTQINTRFDPECWQGWYQVPML